MANRVVAAGINKYPTMPLSGCVNDAQGLAYDLISVLGYNVRNIRLVCDNRATATGIITRIRQMRDVVRPGDVGIVHFSGHGTQVASRDKTEIDGLDEIWCAVDFDWDKERTWIVDDVLVDAITPTSGGRMIVVSDSCHSGDMIDYGNDRDFSAHRPRMVAHRYMPPPVDLAWRVAGAYPPPVRLMARLAATPGIACLSGCQSDQTSADAFIDGESQGAFTWALRYWLRDSPSLTIREIIAKCAQSIAMAGFSQVPTCSGDPDILDRPWPRG